MKKDVKTIVKFLKHHLKVGESYERGEVYLTIGDAETTGTGGSLDWNDEFWKDVEKQLNGLEDKKHGKK